MIVLKIKQHIPYTLNNVNIILLCCNITASIYNDSFRHKIVFEILEKGGEIRTITIFHNALCSEIVSFFWEGWLKKF